MDELWKPVVGFEGIYEVSNHGYIRRIGAWTDGRRNRVHGNRMLNAKRYMRITLYRDKRRKEFPVHRLVYASFIGPLPEGMEINHKNGNKYDNHIDNLEAVTHSQNQIHSYAVLKRTKVMLPGEDHRNAKLTEEQARYIKNKKRQWGDIANFAKEFNVCRGTIEDLIYGKTWKHLR